MSIETSIETSSKTGIEAGGEARRGTRELIETQAADLVTGLVERPWGQVSTSIYETGRVTTLTPWLTGQAARLRHLAATQRDDGGWGGPDGYALVPTLSATEALLAALRRDDPAIDGTAGRETLVKTAAAGLHMLFGRLSGTVTATPLPDMPAIELIVPALIELINGHLDGLAAKGAAGFDPWRGEARLRPPSGMDGGLLAMIRSRVRAGDALPEKLLHALEIAGEAARGVRTVRPLPPGTVGTSPAATAAWLGGVGEPSGDNARRHLAEVARLHGGPVPCGIPVTVFEQGWVLSWLARAGIHVPVPQVLLDSLAAADRPGGTSAGPGLPADADTTSVALYALTLLGSPRAPDGLAAYRTESGFCTWQGEQGFSVTVNAHVLDAVGQYLVRRPETAPAYASTIRQVSRVLCEYQSDNGSWQDRWHASPYYATAACALALGEFGADDATASRATARAGGVSDLVKGAAVERATARAVDWVLETQHADGSWGRWGGTAEETAYALQILLLTPSGKRKAACEEAVTRGRDHLLRSVGQATGPALWHDKDLYRPVAIVRAAVLAALHLTAICSRSDIAANSPEVRKL